MKRSNIFTLRVNHDEKQLISTLANRLQRSQSDALRFVIREVVKELEAINKLNIQNSNQE